jgi:hypothetical protein
MDWRASPYVTPQAGPGVTEGQAVRVVSSPYWSQEARQGSVGTVVSKKVTHVARSGRPLFLARVQFAGDGDEGSPVWSFYESELALLELTRADRRRAKNAARKEAKRA